MPVTGACRHTLTERIKYRRMRASTRVRIYEWVRSEALSHEVEAANQSDPPPGK